MDDKRRDREGKHLGFLQVVGIPWSVERVAEEQAADWRPLRTLFLLTEQVRRENGSDTSAGGVPSEDELRDVSAVGIIHGAIDSSQSGLDAIRLRGLLHRHANHWPPSTLRQGFSSRIQEPGPYFVTRYGMSADPSHRRNYQGTHT